MPATDVVLDTWAWWEFLGGTQIGRRLARRYFTSRRFRVHTSVLTLAELSAKLASLGQARRTRATFARIEGRSAVHAVPREVVEGSGILRSELRKADPNASIIDALILATARHLGAALVSGDGAFRGQLDVRAS